MQLEQRDKELAAIGAAIGCNCRPCIEHHIPAGRDAGLSAAELADAVATARAVRDQAIQLLVPRVDQLLGSGDVPWESASVTEGSRAHLLVALGASIGANSHPLLHRHIAAAHEFGLSSAEVAAAAKMAAYVQKRAGEMTADAVKYAVDELGGVSGQELTADVEGRGGDRVRPGRRRDRPTFRR
jgi:4-carboxymuconolactone decarboxylase